MHSQCNFIINYLRGGFISKTGVFNQFWSFLTLITLETIKMTSAVSSSKSWKLNLELVLNNFYLKYGFFFHIFLYDENFDPIFAQFTPPLPPPIRKCMNFNQLEISNASRKKEVPKSRLLSLKSQPTITVLIMISSIDVKHFNRPLSLIYAYYYQIYLVDSKLCKRIWKYWS